MAKLLHLCLENQTYFITTITEGRKPVFTKAEDALIPWNVLNNQRERGRFHLLGFVIMPDHLHLLIVPRGLTNISFIMQEIKKGSARLINESRGKRGKLSVSEYYDHVIRNENDLMEKVSYIHYNPVKRGLVQNEEGYPFSSANPKYEGFLFEEW